MSLLVVLLVFVCCWPPPVVSVSGLGNISPGNISDVHPLAVWGNCAPYVIHAAASVSFVVPTSAAAAAAVAAAVAVAAVAAVEVLSLTVTGSVAVALSGSADQVLQGYPAGVHVDTGAVDIDNAAASLCRADKVGLTNFLLGLTCDTYLPSADMAEVYCQSPLHVSASTVTLDGANNTDLDSVLASTQR